MGSKDALGSGHQTFTLKAASTLGDLRCLSLRSDLSPSRPPRPADSARARTHRPRTPRIRNATCQCIAQCLWRPVTCLRSALPVPLRLVSAGAGGATSKRRGEHPPRESRSRDRDRDRSLALRGDRLLLRLRGMSLRVYQGLQGGENFLFLQFVTEGVGGSRGRHLRSTVKQRGRMAAECAKAGGCANGVIPSACIYSSLAAVGGVAACAALSTSLRYACMLACTHTAQVCTQCAGCATHATPANVCPHASRAFTHAHTGTRTHTQAHTHTHTHTHTQGVGAQAAARPDGRRSVGPRDRRRLGRPDAVPARPQARHPLPLALLRRVHPAVCARVVDERQNGRRRRGWRRRRWGGGEKKELRRQLCHGLAERLVARVLRQPRRRETVKSAHRHVQSCPLARHPGIACARCLRKAAQSGLRVALVCHACRRACMVMYACTHDFEKAGLMNPAFPHYGGLCRG